MNRFRKSNDCGLKWYNSIVVYTWPISQGRTQVQKQILILMISLVTSIANAQEVCVVPAIGGQAKLPIEFEQPYRIATSPRTVPGFDGLVVKALNRHELYEFNGSSLTLIQNDFPPVWDFAFEHGIHRGLEGNAIGFGSRPRMIFRLGSGASGWEPIEATRDYEGAFFDEGTGDAYWHAPSSKQLRRIGADGVIGDVDLPVFNGSQTVSLRTIPEINGALSLTRTPGSDPLVRASDSIWFRPLGGEWDRVPIELPDGQRLLNTLQDAEIQVVNGFVRIFPSNTAFEPLIFRFSEFELDFVTTLPAGTWEYHTASQNWIGRIGLWSQSTTTGFGFWKNTPETLPPHFLLLGPDETEAQLIPGLTSQSHAAGEKIFYHARPITISRETPVFVHAAEGIVVLDGEPLSQIQVLAYEEIGNHPTVKFLGGLTIIQSELGVFVLNDDFSLDQVNDFPAESPWSHEVNIEFIDAWQSYLVIDRQSGDIHSSKDMRLFKKVETKKRVNGFVGILPNPASVLLIGEEELLVATKVCAS